VLVGRLSFLGLRYWVWVLELNEWAVRLSILQAASSINSSARRVSVFKLALSVDSLCLNTTSLYSVKLDSCYNCNIYKIFFPGQLEQRWSMHCLFDKSHTIIFIMSLWFIPQVMAINWAFWWMEQTKAEWLPYAPGRIHHFDLEQNFASPIFAVGWLLANAAYSSLSVQKTRHFCWWTLWLMLTKSFAPGINLEQGSPNFLSEGHIR